MYTHGNVMRLLSISLVSIIVSTTSYASTHHDDEYTIEWFEAKRTLPTTITSIASGEWNNTIFVIGGSSTNIYYMSLDNLDYTTNGAWKTTQWQNDSEYGTITSMICYPSQCKTTINELLYILSYPRLYIYNMATYSQISGSTYNYTLPLHTYGSCVCNNNTHLFVTGGTTLTTTEQNDTYVASSNSFYIYNIKNDTWIDMTDIDSDYVLNTPRYGHMCQYSDKTKSIYVFGGQNPRNSDRDRVVNSIEIFTLKYNNNHVYNAWKMLTNTTLTSKTSNGVSIIYDTSIWILYENIIDLFNITTETIVQISTNYNGIYSFPFNVQSTSITSLITSDNDLQLKIGHNNNITNKLSFIAFENGGTKIIKGLLTKPNNNTNNKSDGIVSWTVMLVIFLICPFCFFIPLFRGFIKLLIKKKDIVEKCIVESILGCCRFGRCIMNSNRYSTSWTPALPSLPTLPSLSSLSLQLSTHTNHHIINNNNADRQNQTQVEEESNLGIPTSDPPSTELINTNSKRCICLNNDIDGNVVITPCGHDHICMCQE